MTYKFTKKEKEALLGLSIPFDPFSNLSDDEELSLLEIVDDAAAHADMILQKVIYILIF